MHGTPMQIVEPNGVRSSDWLGVFVIARYLPVYENTHGD